MKKKIFFFLALTMMSMNVFADGLTATLQQGDKMTPFYGVDAFKKAYDTAQDGGIITLSAGTFTNVDSISKSIKIVGNFALSETSVERTILAKMTILANNVTIDGIYFSTVTLGNISDCHILHSWMNSLLYTSSSDWHTNTIVDQCVIKNETAIQQGKNYTLKNSTINYFTSTNTTSNIAYITNCFISRWFDYNSSSYKRPYAIYKNNILTMVSNSIGNSSVTLYSPSEFYNNVFYRVNTYSSKYYLSATYANGCVNFNNIYSGASSYGVAPSTYPNKNASFGNGQDGTPIGITGGTGFSEYPQIPRIVSSSIDSSTDSDGKLNVKVKVSVPK